MGVQNRRQRNRKQGKLQIIPQVIYSFPLFQNISIYMLIYFTYTTIFSHSEGVSKVSVHQADLQNHGQFPTHLKVASPDLISPLLLFRYPRQLLVVTNIHKNLSWVVQGWRYPLRKMKRVNEEPSLHLCLEGVYPIEDLWNSI